jgi:hypothetical protein
MQVLAQARGCIERFHEVMGHVVIRERYKQVGAASRLERGAASAACGWGDGFGLVLFCHMTPIFAGQSVLF